jgi:integrase
MLNKMVSDHLIPTNPLAGFKLGKRPGRKNWPPLSDEEVERIVSIAAETSVLPTVAYRERVAGITSIAAYSGIRVSEALALKHADIDVEERSIRVERQITRKGKIVDLKTDFQRDIALTNRAALGLERFPPIEGSEYLYPKRDGTPFNRGSFYHHFAKIVAASGIPGLEFHELRHYLATWMMFQGVPPWAIDYQLGHESGAKVLRTLQKFGISALGILGLEHDGDEVSKLYRHADAIALTKIHEVLDEGTREFAPQVRRSDFVPPKKQVPPRGKKEA